MQANYVLIILLVLGAAAFVMGRARSIQMRNASEPVHSLPFYHGAFFANCTALLPILILGIWLVASHYVINARVASALPAEIIAQSDGDRSLILGTIDTLASKAGGLSASEVTILRGGGDAASTLISEKNLSLAQAPQSYVVDAALNKLAMVQQSSLAMTMVCLALAAVGFFYAWRKQAPAFRARNKVEELFRYVLMGASTIAVLTTIGIVASVLTESIQFFKSVPIFGFLFGTVWDPRFSSAGGGDAAGQFGLLPLLWGTIYITIVALLVAVPVGLTAAIYMSEYASSRMRSFTKPALEVLAGIPTIVYGFFALSTFGPFMKGIGENIGLEISPNSVLSAGFVMGVMIIPFVSSLSDDILSAVPNSLREGSYGLGATQSETIKRVVLPAALPGIVGACLLAVSRAVGETMIVVLAAGIAANLTVNPLQPLTTMTVKIVSQLTGDLEFNSPQTLVAFALGLTLFVFTLSLNVLALHIVRKYREQYE
jgi:phosphate transport system permease protein